MKVCLAIPALIQSVDGNEAEADLGGIRRRIRIWLTPDVRPGDYVLVHAGYAINVLDQEEAEETLRLIREMNEALDASEREAGLREKEQRGEGHDGGVPSV